MRYVAPAIERKALRQILHNVCGARRLRFFGGDPGARQTLQNLSRLEVKARKGAQINKKHLLNVDYLRCKCAVIGK